MYNVQSESETSVSIRELSSLWTEWVTCCVLVQTSEVRLHVRIINSHE